MSQAAKNYRDEPGYHKVMQFIREHCEEGLVLPNYAVIGANCSVSDWRVREYVATMVSDGIIKIVGKYSVFSVIWTETGARTSQRPVLRQSMTPTMRNKRLHDAKQFLRRRHTNVYDCRITGGPDDRVWVSGVGALTHDQVYALAAKSGWVE